ncbi:hypothetical protein J7L06_10730 [Candidatus Bathyarchaeota archaeon]|nr:hypothetical protein [Candidatus Bathyarchaeota archaeon]
MYAVYAVKYLLVENLSQRNDIEVLDFMEKKLTKFNRESFFITEDELEALEGSVDYTDLKVVKKLKEWLRRCGEGEYIVVWEDGDE